MFVGTDITVIARFDKMVEKFGNKAYKRFLNDEEIALVKTTTTAAGFWAAKEAVSKALGCGIGAELSFHDIIIKKSIKNKPLLVFCDEVKKKFSIKQSSLSISHDGGFAIAVVIIEVDI
ncbi:holo-ACP synthase [Arcobacter sp. FWKO B]|uniref:holo-ACP synthase n=1 Tax=Arcobacter sp. FWKO B TaxID=2593672 RepID=UPI0018A340D0|nr:holo-ACP synthase [Arcobacter sp. FWKO B]QOG11663.1 holo-ACP synthase [Arcobacter sp. FWKO B]